MAFQDTLQTKRGFLAYVGVTLVVAAVLLSCAFAWSVHSTSVELQALRAEIRRQGSALGLAELIGEEQPRAASTLAWLEEFERAKQQDRARALSIALRAREQVSLGKADAIVGDDRHGPPALQLPYQALRELTEWLDVEAAKAAQAGDAALALTCLEAGFDVLTLIAEVPSTSGYTIWCNSEEAFMRRLQDCLPSLTAEQDLASLEAQLQALDFAEPACRAFDAGRALGDEVFTELAAGRQASHIHFDEADSVLPMAWWFERDHLRYLRQSQVERLRLELDDSSFAERGKGVSSPAQLSPRRLSDHYAGQAWLLASNKAWAQATRTRILCSLRARREGIEAALTWLTTQTDPLTGMAFFTRREGAVAFILAGAPGTKIEGETEPWPISGPAARVEQD